MYFQIVSYFRRKKLSTFGNNHDWSKATRCVVKRYLDEVPTKTLYEDVRLQMDAKMWGQEYNKHQPPKKVCAQLHKFTTF